MHFYRATQWLCMQSIRWHAGAHHSASSCMSLFIDNASKLSDQLHILTVPLLWNKTVCLKHGGRFMILNMCNIAHICIPYLEGICDIVQAASCMLFWYMGPIVCSDIKPHCGIKSYLMCVHLLSHVLMHSLSHVTSHMPTSQHQYYSVLCFLLLPFST